jgi:hypothetical protein
VHQRDTHGGLKIGVPFFGRVVGVFLTALFFNKKTPLFF